MSGIAGAIDLAGQRALPPSVLAKMAQALEHRGPDESLFTLAGVHFVWRLSSPLLPAQALSNEDGSCRVIAHAGIFNYPEERARLLSRGHALRTDCDVELLPHLWEEDGTAMLTRLRGQFAFALYDARSRRVVLARDRFGICPLYFTRQGDWLLFASEIKALLASGMMPIRPDLRGINHAFTFFALPGPITCFESVSCLLPGHFLDIEMSSDGSRTVRDHTYWSVDFPEQGAEEGGNSRELVRGLEQTLTGAVARRLRGPEPVVAYLSGGADSSLVVALARKTLGAPPPTFTIRIDEPGLDESREVALIAAHLGCQPIAVRVGWKEAVEAYPSLVTAAEGPVLDTACAALLLLAREVRARGYRFALTGEGADEWFGSYPWFRVHRLLGILDLLPGLELSPLVRRLFLRLSGAPLFAPNMVQRTLDAVGGPNAWLDMYGLVSLSKLRFFSPQMRQVMVENNPYADLDLPLARMKKWHPFHRALALGARVHLPGLLLQAKGDRIAMQSGVQMRCPFLDEEVFSFLARLHPRWKMRGLSDKHLLRRVAQRHLPRAIAWKRKALFQAPFEGLHPGKQMPLVDQLLSAESLRKTGYFDPQAVHDWRARVSSMRAGSAQRVSVEMGLTGVFSTQLWHQLFIDPTLAALP